MITRESNHQVMAFELRQLIPFMRNRRLLCIVSYGLISG